MQHRTASRKGQSSAVAHETYSDQGWHAFTRSPRGVVAAFMTLLAVALSATVPSPTQVEQLAQVLLALIALACVAVMAFRDQAPEAATVMSRS